MPTAFIAPVGAGLHRTSLFPASSALRMPVPCIASTRRVPCAILSRKLAKLPYEQASEPKIAAAPVAALALQHLSEGTALPIARSAPRSRRALAVLTWVAAMAARFRRFRQRPGMRVARAGASLALAAIGLAVSRGALGPLAMVSSSGVATTTATAAAPAAVTGPLQVAARFLVGVVPEGFRVLIRPFTEAFGVVFLSEFGDKSMFATALMAMKHSPVLVLFGALVALTLMTLIACFLGQLMHLLPTTVTHYSTIALFVFFGFQMLWQARNLPDKPGAGGERADAEELVATAATASSNSFGVFAKISSLIFVAEWCDRSMLATMALAATSNTAAVIGGATVANLLCTGLAVGSAALVSSKISERLVALVAGILFEFFAVFTFLEGPEGE